MRNIFLVVLLLSVHLNANAKLSKQSTDTSHHNHHSTMIYGGKDLSRSIVAIAHESNWTKEQPVAIG